MTKSMRDLNSERAKLAAPAQPWEWGIPIYSWLALSTFSPVEKHGWVRPLDLPYEIVLLPGYKRPTGLEVHDIDSLWYDREVTEPLAVWDGEAPTNLFEMISMCFDPRGEIAEFIKLRDKASGAYLTDPRPIEMLKQRPVRKYPGSIESRIRSAARKEYIKDELAPYYAKWGKEIGAWGISESFNTCYQWHNKHVSYHAGNQWRRLVRMHPEVEEKFLLSIKPERRQVVPGMKFGYALFEKAMDGKPDWYEAKLSLDYLVETRNPMVESAYQIASFKQARGIPLDEADEKALRKGGDYASKGLRSVLNKFYRARRRA